MPKELDILLSDELSAVLEEKETTVTGGKTAQLLVYNDDFNTFDWVIQCFMEVCNHTFEQSEQLSLIVHYKGKAVVKTGAFRAIKAHERSSFRKRPFSGNRSYSSGISWLGICHNGVLFFPHPFTAEEDGLLAFGGKLSCDNILLAYSFGIFPWYNEGDPILWWSTHPRLVIKKEDFKIKKVLT